MVTNAHRRRHWRHIHRPRTQPGRAVAHPQTSQHPDNPAQAMLAGLDAITPGGLTALTRVSHGSTVATNAILERKGAKTALITTAGVPRPAVHRAAESSRPLCLAAHPAPAPHPPPVVLRSPRTAGFYRRCPHAARSDRPGYHHRRYDCSGHRVR